MKIYSYTDTEDFSVFGKRAIALGFFDGVHIGHRKIFEVARAEADRLDIPFSILTFPAESTSLKSNSARLYSTAQKLRLFEQCGADEVFLVNFDKIKELSAEDFAYGFLIKKCGAHIAVTGRDYRFSKGAAADADDLKRILELHGAAAIAVDDVSLFSKKVSTTAIKEYLEGGEIEKANAMLGSPYTVSGTVEPGRKVGRRLGFPTVNCPLECSGGILKKGVYLSYVTIAGNVYPALTNVGTCPTFEERKEHTETYILDFDSTVYGENVCIQLYKFLREEKHFQSEKELKMQINIDINTAKKEFDK